MRKVMYKASNPYSCQGVRLTPGHNDVEDNKFDDFIKHPGVIARIGLGIIEVLAGKHQEKSPVKKKDDNKESQRVIPANNPAEVKVDVVKEELEANAEQLMIDKKPVKEVVEKVKRCNSLEMLMRIVENTDSVRIKKAAEERIEEILKN